RGVIKLRGKVSGRDFVRDVPIELPENESRHDVLATLWARTRIDDLMSQDYNGIQNGNPRDDIRESITQLSLNFRLMSQFTSFVAVEEVTVTDGGEPRKIEVPVEMPEGVSQEGVFVRGDQPFEKLQLLTDLQRAPLARKAPASGGGRGADRKTSVTASRGELPKVSLKAGTPPASPQPKARAGKDSIKGSAGGIGRGSRGGMGGADGRGVGPGTSSNMGGGDGVPSPLSPEEQKRREFLSKVNPSIAAVID